MALAVYPQFVDNLSSIISELKIKYFAIHPHQNSLNGIPLSIVNAHQKFKVCSTNRLDAVVVIATAALLYLSDLIGQPFRLSQLQRAE